jgi:hypothetical protein
MPICIQASVVRPLCQYRVAFRIRPALAEHDSSREGWPYLEMSAYLLMTIRNWEFQQVLIKHVQPN